MGEGLSSTFNLCGGRNLSSNQKERGDSKSRAALQPMHYAWNKVVDKLNGPSIYK
jgi:hypothetical protein